MNNMASATGAAGNVIAGIASFIIPGLGQLLQGRVGAAFFFFILCAVLWAFLLGWVVNLGSAFGAATYTNG